MDSERFDSRAERSDDMDADDSPYRDRRGGGDDIDFKEDGAKEARKKSGSRRDEKDHRSKDRERDDKVSSRDRRKEDRDDREKDKRKDYSREEGDKRRDKEHDRDRKDRGKERERGEVVVKDDNKVKERSGREKGREKYREKDRGRDRDKEAESRDRERLDRKGDHPHEHDDRNKDDKVKSFSESDNVAAGRGQNSEVVSAQRRVSTTELQERIQKAKEGRTKKKAEGASELLDWVNKSRKLEEKRNAEKEKAAQLSKMFEEQDNIGHEDSEDEEGAPPSADHLAGVKVLHGLDKVVEGGAVVLTLKDQSILADGDINEEVDMLENVEIGEQKRRDDAYKAAKKKTGIYADKFSDDPDAEKKMLPQYDDPTEDEGVTLDARGRITGEAEKKLEELRKKLQGAPNSNHFEDLTSTAKVSLDYYTQEEMVQFKKPKKKKSLRKKEKLNIDALEAEAVAAGLGVGDLGSRNDRKRQAIREEEERAEAERKSNAYKSAYAKAEEASKSLRMELTSIKEEDEENNGNVDDDEDLYKSLERARKLALKKQNEKRASGPEAVALLASTIITTQAAERNSSAGEQHEERIVITEMEEFVGGLQLDEESRRPDREDVFMDEDEAPASDHEHKDEDGGWGEVKEATNNEVAADDNEEDIAPDETIHETAVGKGLSGALKLLQDRGALKESVEWGGRNMDKKKSKLVGLTDQEGGREIRIERLDEFGRTLTPKEAFRLLSHKFHGKGPGKMKQEKRMKQYYEDLKLKQMKNADTPSLSAERMREAQAQLKTPYLVLSGHVKPGQNSDPRSGFATVEKDLGSLTPMLGDRKVEHFLGIKRKLDASSSGSVKKPKT